MVGFNEYKQQQTESTQRNVDKDNLFLTENYGGLNLESSSVNMPLSDSPSLLNIEIETSGKIRKRRGSKVLNNFPPYVDCHVPFKLVDGALIHVLISHSVLYVVNDGNASIGGSLYSATVYPTTTPYQGKYQMKTNHAVITHDDKDLIVFTREGACPIVLIIKQEKGTPTSNTYVFRDATLGTRRDTTKTTNCFYEQSGTIYTVSSIVGSTATLSGTPTAGVAGTFFTLHWGWIPEAMWLPKDSITNNLVFPQVAPGVDNVQELKPVMQRALLQDMYPAQVDYAAMTAVSNVYADRFPGIACTSNPFDLTVGGGLLTFYNLGYANPQTITWATANLTLCARPTWGDAVTPGSWQIGTTTSAVSTDTTALQVGYSHFTFGGFRYTDAAYTVPGKPVMPCILRFPYIPMNGGAGVQARYINVVDDITGYTFNTGTTRLNAGANYWLWVGSGAGTITQCATNSAPGTWLRLDVGAWLGIWGSDLMVINSDISSSFLGSSAVRQNPAAFSPTTDGGMYIQALGLYRYANYKTGSFPAICGMYQDRLVFTGFPTAPGTVLLSNVGYSTEFSASSWYGVNYKSHNFETGIADPDLPTSPFAIKLNLTADEKITALAQWYDDLFIGTTKAVYRVHGGELVAVNPQNYFVSKVASVGCVNRGMTLTQDGVCFLSDAGVYKIVIDTNTGAYTVENIGIKIRKAIAAGMGGGRFYNGCGEITYDNKQNVLYAAVGDSSSGSTMRLTPRRLFVYYFDRKAWSEWGTVSGYFPVNTLQVTDGRLFANCWETALSPGTELRNLFIEMNIDNLFIDFMKTGTVGDLVADDIEIQHPRGRGVWNGTGYTADFAIDLKNPGSEQPIKTIPLKEAGWVTAFISPNRKYEGTDFIRRNENVLCYFSSFGANWFEVEQNLPSGDRPMIVWHNTESRYVAQSEYNYNVSSAGFAIRALAAGDALDGDSVTVGLAYPTWWMSPVFTRNDIMDYKRFKHFYAVFENTMTFGNVTTGAAQWSALTQFNVALIQNGTRSGDTQVNILSSDSLTDIATNEPGWNDFYRVVLPFKGNATGFQACVYSFDQHQWELTGYQIETEVEGRTSKRADNS